MPLGTSHKSSREQIQVKNQFEDTREDEAARIIQHAWRQRRQSALKAESRWADATIHARVQVCLDSMSEYRDWTSFGDRLNGLQPTMARMTHRAVGGVQHFLQAGYKIRIVL